jgi:hypothetical protein
MDKAKVDQWGISVAISGADAINISMMQIRCEDDLDQPRRCVVERLDPLFSYWML